MMASRVIGSFELLTGAADAPFGDNEELLKSRFIASFKQTTQHIDLGYWALVLQPHEDHSFMAQPLPINHFAEVFVIGDEYPVLSECFVEYGVVVQATSLIIYGEHLMTLRFKPAGYLRPGTFIHKEPQSQLANGTKSLVSSISAAKRMQACMSSA